MSSNPYHPPAAELERAEEALQRRRPVKFPFAMVFRWLLGAGLAVYGLLRFLNVLARWTELADRTIIDHSYSPYLWLGIEASLFATGALLLARSRWIFLPLLLHVTLSACRSFGFGHAVVIANHDYLNWSGEIAVLGFSLWLLLNRRLR